LVPLVYDELRRIARRCLVGKGKGHTPQPTALVHEAYLRLVKTGDGSNRWQDRMHFFCDRGAGDEADTCRSRAQADGCEERRRCHHNSARGLDARQCLIVELRFFGGLSIEEAAQVADVSPATAKRDWATARLWLHQEMGEGHPA
jgi:ECF sigma factor